MPEAVDTLFVEAVDALKQGDRTRSRDLLTRLLKANQNNTEYWMWMSAAVDTLKERVYCLETVLKLDPRHEGAKRGLMLLGALPPPKHVKPFPLNRKRHWEAQLALADEASRQTALQAFGSSPAVQLAATLLAGLVLISAVLLLGFSSRSTMFRIGGGAAAPTIEATSTPVNLAAIGVETRNAPTPLAVLLGISYTATPVYANTPRAPQSAAAYLAAQDALKRGAMDDFLDMMEQVQAAEPEAPDVEFQIGEVYRHRNECRTALYHYNEALKIDDGFAPAYLGLARARLCSEPSANVLQLYQLARDSDRAYGEVYLDRALYYISKGDHKNAMPDLQEAARLMPRSALVQLAYAQAYLLQDKPAQALPAAEKAYATDRTLLPAYYYLGRASVESQAYEKAVEPLQIFVLYESENARAWSYLGIALAEIEDYEAAVDALNEAVRLDRNQVDAYLPLGISYLKLGNMAGAEVNFKRALEYSPGSFEATIGLTEIYYSDGTYGTAYLQAETAMSRAVDDSERARALYWRALSHEGRGSLAEALADWRELLRLPRKDMTPEMRTEAQAHLQAIPTLTPTPLSRFDTGTPRPGSSATPPPPKPTIATP